MILTTGLVLRQPQGHKKDSRGQQTIHPMPADSSDLLKQAVFRCGCIFLLRICFRREAQRPGSKAKGPSRTPGLVPRKPRGAQKLEADPQQDTPLDFQGTASRSCGLFFKRAGKKTSPVAELFGGLKGKPRGHQSPFWRSNLKK